MIPDSTTTNRGSTKRELDERLAAPHAFFTVT